MSSKFMIFPDPLDARTTLRHDNGFVGTGVPDTDHEGRPGQSIMIPDYVPNENGAELTVEKEGYVGINVRGFLVLKDGVARLQVDDYNLVPADNTDPTDPGDVNPNANPIDIINHVYNSTNPNLSTASGCGLFTEDVVKELHEKMNPGWGHVKKEPGQNQFNGHAVDAIHLLVPSGGTAPGIYDIIQSSASPEAKPVFNYADPPDNSLWYYPPAPIKSGQDMKAITVWHKGGK